MISPTDTAFPVLTASPSASELTDAFTPDVFELKFAEERTREPAPRVGLLTLLKTFQRIGYFVKLTDVPRSITRTIAQAAGYDGIPEGLDRYDETTVRVRHMALVRAWIGVSTFDRAAFKTVVKSCVEASRVREDLADIINIAIEELLRKRYELPGFTTLFRAARSALLERRSTGPTTAASARPWIRRQKLVSTLCSRRRRKHARVRGKPSKTNPVSRP